MSTAAFSRILQFRAGPNEHKFFACRQHRDLLSSKGEPNFFATADEPVKPITEDEEGEECDFCREGGN